MRIDNTIEGIFRDISIPLTNFAYNILRNKHDSQDMVSETFLKALEYIYIHKELPGKPFYFTVIRNISIDFLRKKKRIIYTEESDQLVEKDAVSSEVFDEVYEVITEELVGELLKKLSGSYANIFYLRYKYEMSFTEIGGIMGIEEGNARLIFHRARRKLEKLYHEKFKEENECEK